MTAQPSGRRTRELWPEEAPRASPGPFIDLWEDDGGFWQWTYTDDGTRLPSNRSYPTKEAAEESARIAYPRIPFREASAPPAPRRRRLWPWVALLMFLAVVGLIAVVVLIAIGVVVMALARRRVRRVLRS